MFSRRRHRRSLTILMYHRFDCVPDAARKLDEQLRYLRRHFAPLPLAAAAQRLVRKEPLPHNALCISVDDGHADFRDIAVPALIRHGLPATLYVTTNFVDGAEWLWFDRIEFALLHSRRSRLVTPGVDKEFDVATVEQRRACFHELMTIAKGLPDQERRRLPGAIASALDVRLPDEPPPQYAPVSWSDLRALRRSGVEVGVHTRSHPVLSRVEDPVALDDEIGGARQRIETELGAPPLSFCYPNGRPEDISLQVVEAVRRADLDLAVTTVRDRAYPGADPLQLPRIGVGPELAPGYFRRLVSGLST